MQFDILEGERGSSLDNWLNYKSIVQTWPPLDDPLQLTRQQSNEDLTLFNLLADGLIGLLPILH